MRATLRIAGFVVVGCIFLAFLVLSLLTSELCHYDQQAEHRQGEPHGDEQGADNVPVLSPGAIELATGGNQQTQTYRQQRRSNGKLACDLLQGTSTTDRVIAVATLAYLLVTFLMWQAVRRQAEIAERTITDLERPWLLLELQWPPRVIEEHQGGKFSVDSLSDDRCINIEVAYTITNEGRSPAWIIRDSLELIKIPGLSGRDCNWSLPDEPMIPPDDVEVPLGPKREEQDSRIIALDGAERYDMAHFQLGLMLFGVVQYRDVSKKRILETGFSWIIERPYQGSIPAQGQPIVGRWGQSAWERRRGPSRYWRCT